MLQYLSERYLLCLYCYTQGHGGGGGGGRADSRALTFLNWEGGGRLKGFNLPQLGGGGGIDMVQYYQLILPVDIIG